MGMDAIIRRENVIGVATKDTAAKKVENGQKLNVMDHLVEINGKFVY